MCCWLFDPRKASRVDHEKVNCPMLVISGEKDRTTPAKVVKKVADKYGADYKAFDNHAHWVLGEPGWEEVAGYVSSWLETSMMMGI